LIVLVAMLASLTGSAAIAQARDEPLPISDVDIQTPRPPVPDRLVRTRGGKIIRVRVPHPQEGIGGDVVVRLTSAPFQAEIYSPAPPSAYPEPRYKGLQPWELAHRCGGSLIAEAWVLTAAHCVNEERLANGYRVRLGTLSILGNSGTTYRIDRIVRHADWDDTTKANDIALVHIAADVHTRPAAMKDVRPVHLQGMAVDDPVPVEAPPSARGGGVVELPRLGEPRRRVAKLADGSSFEEAQNVDVLGWGRTKPGPGGHYSVALVSVGLDLVDRETCRQDPTYAKRVTAAMICAARSGKDACTGDSGGPLMLHYDRRQGDSNLPSGDVQIGIVSWGLGCAEPGHPGVYTRVSAYIDWIRRAMATPTNMTYIQLR
jgi:hypothetical protein